MRGTAQRGQSLNISLSLSSHLSDRHVVVYKAGHETSDDPTATPLVIPSSSGLKKPKPKAAEFTPLPLGALTKANQVKRDRRTIEEVQSVSCASGVISLLSSQPLSGN
jgi:hypothetical protein